MKKVLDTIIFGGIFVLALIACSSSKDDNENKNDSQNLSITVMSYNILTDDRTGENSWDSRKAGALAMLDSIAPDLIGMQEVKPSQKAFFDANLKNYQALGIPRDNSGLWSEYNNIYYRSDKYTVLETNTFWLSETPDVMSKGWDAEYYRICTYGKFQINGTDKTFFLFNTHMPLTVEAEKNATTLLISKIKEIAGDNAIVFVTGDFNMTPEDSNIISFAQYCNNTRTQFPNDINYYIPTFNHFGKTMSFIDYVWYRNSIPKSYNVIHKSWAGIKYISDHYPITGVFAIKNQ